jgi:hypothetical protein
MVPLSSNYHRNQSAFLSSTLPVLFNDFRTGVVLDKKDASLPLEGMVHDTVEPLGDIGYRSDPSAL